MGFAEDHLIPLADEGLGNSAYLLDLGDGRARTRTRARSSGRRTKSGTSGCSAVSTAVCPPGPPPATRRPPAAFVTAGRTDGRPYADVRQQSEFTAGHVPGAVNIELGGLVDAASDAPHRPVVACGHGERAMTAASLLERAGHTDVAVLDGGPADYAAAEGLRLVQGTEDTRS